jgi:Flp pilus assembly protein TadD
MSRTLTLFSASAYPAEPAGRPRAVAPETGSAGAGVTGLDEAAAVVAERCLRTGRYRSARRHLRAALRRNPADARCRYLLGRAHADDPHGCDRRAARHYRKAATLNASEPLYRAALGRALVRIDDIRSGVNVLRRAAEAAPADAEVLTIVVEGLREAGEAELAFQLLTKARFLAPANQDVLHLWNRTRFDVAAREQKAVRAEVARPEPQRVVPFLRLVGGNTAPDSARTTNRTRHDHPSQPDAHVGRLLRPFRG